MAFVIIANGVVVGFQADPEYANWHGWLGVESAFAFFLIAEILLRMLVIQGRKTFFCGQERGNSWGIGWGMGKHRAGFLRDPLMLAILGGHVIQPKVRLSIQVMFLHSGFSRNLKFVVQHVTLFYITSKTCSLCSSNLTCFLLKSLITDLWRSVLGISSICSWLPVV